MSRPIIEVVREYANAQGCVVLKGKSFISRDGKRSVRFVEVKHGQVTVWDTGTLAGYVSLSRERRVITKSTLKAQGDALEGGTGSPMAQKGGANELPNAD
jgi:hypothetical protein